MDELPEAGTQILCAVCNPQAFSNPDEPVTFHGASGGLTPAVHSAVDKAEDAPMTDEIPPTIHGFTPEHLGRLNSATQYPSILTYHALGERGRLTEERTADFSTVDPDDVEVSEKIDGTSARIIILPRRIGGPLIGSRTELLHYTHDVIANPAQGIVDATLRAALGLRTLVEPHLLVVVFGEVYGGKTSSGAKNYSTTGNVGFRLFDVATVPLEVLGWERDRIASWRDSGGQSFARTDVLAQVADEYGLDLVPLLASTEPPPVSVADTHEWLTKALTATHAALDDSGKGYPEGVVVRTADRSLIAKIRFEDYERTAKARR